MTFMSCRKVAAALLLMPVSNAAAEAPAVQEIIPAGTGQAAGFDAFYSSDADETEVMRLGLNLDLSRKSNEEYFGIAVEKARFNPGGNGWQSDERLYLRAADQAGKWNWNARIGSDGRTVLGSASIHDQAKNRKEFFLEREIVETRRGLSDGIYYTFAGAALDLPLDDRNVLTLIGGLQEFTGSNVRTHARANFVHVVEPSLGLSAQLRARYFRSSHPNEADYYSPRWFAEILPVVQVRRFYGGWQLLGAAGLGWQRDSDTEWRQSRYLHARFTSPSTQSGWHLNAGLTYTNTPSVSGAYSYFQTIVGASKSF